MGDESRFRYRLDEGLARESAAGDARAQDPRRSEARARSSRDHGRADAGYLPPASSASYSDGARDHDYGRAPAQAGGAEDSLAELAKLIGDEDPFADFNDMAQDTRGYGAEAPQPEARAERFAAPVPVRGPSARTSSAYEAEPAARPGRSADFSAYGRSAGDARAYDDRREAGHGYRQEAERYDDPRYDEPRHSEPRYDQPHHDDPRYAKARYDDATGGSDSYDDAAYGADEAGAGARDDHAPGDYAPGDYASDDYAPARREPQLPARLSASRDLPVTTGRGAVRSGYGSLARQAAAPSPRVDDEAAFDRRQPDARGYGQRGHDARGYDRDGYAADEEDDRVAADRGYAEPSYDDRAYDDQGYAADGHGRGKGRDAGRYDDRAYDDRAYDDRSYDDRAYGDRAPADRGYAGRALDDRVHDGRVHDDRARDDRVYDDQGYDDQGYDERGYDDRAYDERGRDAQGRGRYGEEAAYAYSSQRRGNEDGYDSYDDAYDPDFAEDGYMPPHGEEVYEGEPRRRKGRMALLMAVSAIGLVVAGIAVFFAYRMAVGAPGLVSSGTPPVIRADSSPSKIVSPAPPATDNQQKLIYDRVGGGANPNEQVVPREEQPVDVATASTGTTGASAGGGATEPKRVRTLTVRADGSIVPGAPSEAAPASAGSPVSAYAPNQNPIPTGLPDPTPVNTVSTSGAQTASASPPVSANGAYVVQVASQRSEADAMGSWRALQTRYPSLLGSYRASVKRADLGERGVYYRAQVGPFASRDQANDLCQSLRAQGGDCIVSKN